MLTCFGLTPLARRRGTAREAFWPWGEKGIRAGVAQAGKSTISGLTPLARPDPIGSTSVMGWDLTSGKTADKGGAVVLVFLVPKYQALGEV